MTFSRTAPRTARTTRRPVLLAAALALGLMGPALPAVTPTTAVAATPARSVVPALGLAAATPLPGAPKDVRVKALTPTSIKVSWKKSKRATGYRAVLQTGKWTGKIKTSKRVKGTSVVITGVPVSSVDYWVKVVADNKRRSVSNSKPVRANAKPTTPTKVKVVGSSAHGVTVRWSKSKNAQGYRVQVSTTKNFAGGTRSYRIPAEAGAQFTANNLAPGTRHYVRVRAINTTGASGYSPKAKAPSAVTKQAGVAVTVATSNLLLAGAEPSDAAGWADRRGPLSELLRSASPDFYGVQEADTRTSPFAFESSTQLDDFVSLTSGAGRSYRVASSGQTTRKPEEPVHIVYDAASWSTRDSWGGRLRLSSDNEKKDRWMMWQILQHKQTGSRVFVANTHLSNGRTSASNRLRAKQTDQIAAEIARRNTASLPVVILGDLNAYDGVARTTPMTRLAGARYVSADLFAAKQVNDKFTSMNKLQVKPLSNGLKVDHIFTSADIAQTRFTVLVRTSGGSYVTPFPSDHNPLVAELVLPR